MPWGRGSTRQSRKDRAVVLRLHPICYLQLEGCTQTSTEDDHVVPVFEGGTDALSNRRGACGNCHGIKSHGESARARSATAGLARHPLERPPGLL